MWGMVELGGLSQTGASAKGSTGWVGRGRDSHGDGDDFRGLRVSGTAKSSGKLETGGGLVESSFWL